MRPRDATSGKFVRAETTHSGPLADTLDDLLAAPITTPEHVEPAFGSPEFQRAATLYAEAQRKAWAAARLRCDTFAASAPRPSLWQRLQRRLGWLVVFVLLVACGFGIAAYAHSDGDDVASLVWDADELYALSMK